MFAKRNLSSKYISLDNDNWDDAFSFCFSQFEIDSFQDGFEPLTNVPPIENESHFTKIKFTYGTEEAPKNIKIESNLSLINEDLIPEKPQTFSSRVKKIIRFINPI